MLRTVGRLAHDESIGTGMYFTSHEFTKYVQFDLPCRLVVITCLNETEEYTFIWLSNLLHNRTVTAIREVIITMTTSTLFALSKGTISSMT